MAMLRRFGTFRQLHTIISKEIIKPSSPTPPHLQTYNLSLVDCFSPNIYMPLVFFYPNYNNSDMTNLKKSLSQCLTQYYPFAGRLSPYEGHIDCNDQGIEFMEASHDNRIEDFIFKKEQDKTCQLSPNGLGSMVGKSSPNLVEVQLNHFKGGGAALAVSTSHKVADGFTMANFIYHWATLARGGSPINLNVRFSSSTSYNAKAPEIVFDSLNDDKYVTRMFVFPNSKLNELRKKVKDMGIAPTDPTRVELLTSLIFKCEADATITKKGSLITPNLACTVNMRNKIIKNNLENTAGNIYTMLLIKPHDPSNIRLNEVVGMLRNGKNKLEGLKDVQQVGENYVNTMSMLGGEMYSSSSVCRFPMYDIDFGWGKPAEAIIDGPNTKDRVFVLMDTPHKDGIVARVRLPEEEMLIFQEHKELLGYINNP